jgi:uncharacterized membrane protein YoaK (UPF0700 family)
LNRALLRAAGLCFVAGYVDAIGYLQLGGVFAANMTGNSVLIAIAALQGEWKRVASYALTLAVFFLGAVAGALLRHASRREALPLFAAAALLLIDAVVSFGTPIRLALLAATMGLQGASVSRFGSTTLQTVVVTATIIRLADGCVGRLWPEANNPNIASIGINAASWIAYVVGAGAGAAGLHFLTRPLFVAVAVLAVIAIDIARNEG